jgi:hypothetical protein
MTTETVSPIMTCELTCPNCRARHREAMLCDACIYFYECTSCGTVLRPKPGDCCVFCSYGSVPCPPKQIEPRGNACCASADVQSP